MSDLKLQALDADDLKVLSAHCQDAVVAIGDMAFEAGAKRFALVCNRFDWAAASRRGGLFSRKTYERRRSGLRFERVTGVKVTGFDPRTGDKSGAPALTLLAITYRPTEAENPAGQIVLMFGGGAAVRLDVELVEAELRDLGAVWSTESKPDHDTPADSKPGGTTKS
ncbi:MAG: DUF2948 family protein [Verrucomicrobiae bacterium]|nr:DUF2948 family protein [Verrucomicrobiae bacterium]